MSRKQLIDVYEQIFEAVDSPEDGKLIRIVFWTSVGNASRPYMMAEIDRHEAMTNDGGVNPDICRLVKAIVFQERIDGRFDPAPIDLVDVCVA